ncbi:MAG: TrpB-like pyridoxal-phosphate dependent enzyme, partial [Micrococcales bacterium]
MAAGHAPAATVPAGTAKVILPESQIPTHWYNVAADLPEPCPPPLHPGTRQPL